MSIEYVWSFPSLEVVYSSVDPATSQPVENAVSVVHWICTAKDAGYEAMSYSSVSLPPPGNPFVNYSDLTPSIVQGWTVAALGEEYVNSMQASLAENIDQQKNPTSGSVAPPWS